MTLKKKTMKFHNNSITFAQLPNGKWVVPAKLLGLALGYADEGRKLVEHLASWDLKQNDERFSVESHELAVLKKDAPEFGASFGSNSLTLLTIQGVAKVLMASRSKLAKEFRSFLTMNAGELLPETLKSRLGGSRTRSDQLPLPLMTSPGRQTVLDELMGTLEKGKKWGLFSKDELKTVLLSIKDIQFARFKSEANAIETRRTMDALTSIPYGKDATQMVPVSNIQASSMTPNFDSVRSFFLTGHQKHPKHIDWLSAEEIGKLVDKTADQVKNAINKVAVEDLGHELPNNMATGLVASNGGYFKGVASLVDGHNIPCFIDEELGGMAAWYLMEDGKLVWRNYWSPTIVRKVLDKLGFHNTPLPLGFSAIEKKTVTTQSSAV